MKSQSQTKKTEAALNLRKKFRGLVGVKSKLPVKDSAALSSVYTPGVGEVCLEVQKDLLTSYDYTCRGNTIAIISDGSAVFGMGNLGPYAVLPALETKSIFHKTFAGVDAFPLPINTQDVDELVHIIKMIEPTFGGFHLEDISSPRCFELENKLRNTLTVPFLHVDQEGAGVAVLAALLNSLKLVHKKPGNISVVISGVGSGGISVGKLLHHIGVGNVILCDSHGAIYDGRQEDMNWAKLEVAKYTNKEHKRGPLSEVIKGADVFIGLSGPKALNQDMVKSMAADPIVFALALPIPEITYNEAKLAGAKVVATGRSDSPNQVSSAIAAPGIFRGALDVRSSEINKDMLVAAAHAMADLVEEDELSPQYVLPRVLDFRTAPAIAKAVAQAAIKTNVARFKADPDVIERKTLEYIYEGEENAWVDPPSHEELDDKTPIGVRSIQMHKRHHGVIEVKAKLPIKDNYIYDLAYASPGAAEPCRLIYDNKEKVYDLTCKNNMVAVITDGTAVLGLGDIGPTAGLPVMEGKAVLFKTLGGVEAFPICVGTKDIDEIVRITQLLEPVFGGVNLEDISAPNCFEIEEKLKKISDIPIFHDDQHGTAVVVLAGLSNALKLTGKNKETIKVIMNGAGASSIAVCKLLIADGFKNIIMCDTKGAIYKGRKEGMNPYKEFIAEHTNPKGCQGKLVDVLAGSDVFIGLSKGNLLNQEMVRSMNPDPIILALANPYPEIMPDQALAAGAKIIATGRSDFPNQINNSIAFPGIFRGALDVRAKQITDEMKVAAAMALANLIPEEKLSTTNIIPHALDLNAPIVVAEAVARTAIETGMARVHIDPKTVGENLKTHLYEYGELRALFEK